MQRASWKLYRFLTVRVGWGRCCSLPTCYLFDNGYSSKCEVVSHCGCDLHFPDNQWCGVSFHVPVGYVCLFWEKWLFFNCFLGDFFFSCWSVCILYIFCILTHVENDWRIFSPVQWCFLLLRSFLIWHSPTCLHLLLLPLFLVSNQNTKNYHKTEIKELTTCVFFEEFYGFRSYIQIIWSTLS